MKKETTLSNLLNNKGGLHAGTAVRFAVVTIGSGGIEFHFEGVSRLAELVVHGNLLLIDAIRDVVLIEDNVVGSSLVVDPETNRFVIRFCELVSSCIRGPCAE